MEGANTNIILIVWVAATLFSLVSSVNICGKTDQPLLISYNIATSVNSLEWKLDGVSLYFSTLNTDGLTCIPPPPPVPVGYDVLCSNVEVSGFNYFGLNILKPQDGANYYTTNATDNRKIIVPEPPTMTVDISSNITTNTVLSSTDTISMECQISSCTKPQPNIKWQYTTDGGTTRTTISIQSSDVTGCTVPFTKINSQVDISKDSVPITGVPFKVVCVLSYDVCTNITYEKITDYTITISVPPDPSCTTIIPGIVLVVIGWLCLICGGILCICGGMCLICGWMCLICGKYVCCCHKTREEEEQKEKATSSPAFTTLNKIGIVVIVIGIICLIICIVVVSKCIKSRDSQVLTVIASIGVAVGGGVLCFTVCVYGLWYICKKRENEKQKQQAGKNGTDLPVTDTNKRQAPLLDKNDVEKADTTQTSNSGHKMKPLDNTTKDHQTTTNKSVGQKNTLTNKKSEKTTSQPDGSANKSVGPKNTSALTDNKSEMTTSQPDGSTNAPKGITEQSAATSKQESNASRPLPQPSNLTPNMLVNNPLPPIAGQRLK